MVSFDTVVAKVNGGHEIKLSHSERVRVPRGRLGYMAARGRRWGKGLPRAAGNGRGRSKPHPFGIVIVNFLGEGLTAEEQ